MNNTTTSKFLSLVLRHKPEEIGIKLDENGWVNVNVLLTQLALHGKSISFEYLENIVSTNDKKRFAFNEDKSMIRANQGHSVDVDLAIKESIPPKYLYHGTALKNLDSIKLHGLQKRQRHHVHLTEDEEIAMNVGQRYGEPYLFTILAEEMHNDGFLFYKTENEVWLTDSVPPKYLISLYQI